MRFDKGEKDMKYDINSYLDKISKVEQGYENRTKELTQEEAKTRGKLEELKTAMTDSLSAEALEMPIKTSFSSLEKQHVSFKDRLVKIASFIPIIQEAKAAALEQEVQELGTYYRETIQPQMKLDSQEIEHELKVRKAAYMSAVRDLHILMQEQERVHNYVVGAFHRAGIAQKAPQPAGTAVQIKFKNGYAPVNDLSGITKHEIKEVEQTGNLDPLLEQLLK